jgi:hypothetical protein
MLRPKKSLLAVFGVTGFTEGLARLTGLSPCSNCALPRCQYRRLPYRRESPLDGDARYAVNLKALKRWAGERLTLEPQEDGAIEALFRYQGTTCTNLGRELEFHYRVRLAPREDGYRIIEQCCAPAPNDTGHTAMCRYQDGAAKLMAAIRDEKPLAGRPLNDVLSWSRPSSPAGCYCDAESRRHKWGLVLETIHYALAQRET